MVTVVIFLFLVTRVLSGSCYI